MTDKKDRPEPEWTLAECGTELREQILACREVTFEGEELEKQRPEYWDWEFPGNHAGPARLFVAEHEGRVVGHYAVIPQRFWLDGETLNGSIVVDVMTHPDYRYQGMFTKIGRFSLEACREDPKFEFTTGYPIRPAVLPGHLKVGWRVRFKIGTYVLPLSFGRLLAGRFSFLPSAVASLLGAIPHGILRGLARLRLAKGRRALRPGGLRIERVERISDFRDRAAFEQFLERYREEYPPSCLGQERSLAWLKWRFDDNPGRDYVFHVLRDGEGTVLAYAVSRVSELLDVSTLILVDYAGLEGDRDRNVAALVSDLDAMGKDHSCAMLAMMLTQPDPLFPKPSKFGFLAAPYKFTFITKDLADATRSEEDALAWHLMWGDTDDV